MKRTICLLLALVMAFAMAACAKPAENPAPTGTPVQTAPPAETEAPQESPSALAFTPGTYTGEAQGFGGALKLEVTVDETSILSDNVLENSETEGIGSIAVEKLPAAIVAAQSLGVDTVSGCTMSSNAILEAAKAALSQSGVNMEALTAAPAAQEDAPAQTQNLETQVVIVGAGGAGMTAAIKLREQGVNVIVLEKMPMVGGATAMSSSSALAQGTRTQAEAGVEDSAEMCMMDLLYVGRFENDPTPTWLLSAHSGETIDWLNDEIGVLFNEATGNPSAEYRVGRARSSVTGSGAGLAQDLRAKMEEMGATLMLETRAYELKSTDGAVDGVLARDNSGNEYVIQADAVVLATGGYCFDDEYIDPSLKVLPCSGSKANTGDGIHMALPYGAVLQNMEMVAVAGHGIRKGDSAQHTKPGCLVAYRTTGTILVNMQGERFINERGSDASIVEAMRQTDRCFMLMDAASFEEYARSCVDKKYFSQEELDQWLAENGTGVTVFAHGDTLEELAATVSMDAAGLAATVEKYNGFVAAGEDADFGREVTAPIGEGPYYLVEQCLRYSTTLGGLTINSQLQLVDAGNVAIPGLYAAGEVVGGVFGASFPPSAGVGWALTSGRMVGEQIASALQ